VGGGGARGEIIVTYTIYKNNSYVGGSALTGNMNF
jgi:hypothetical protein